MRLQLIALCDAANVSVEGKLNILGEFDTVFAAVMPVMHPSMILAAKYQVGQDDHGVHRLNVSILDDDMNVLGTPTEVELPIDMSQGDKDGNTVGYPILVALIGTTFTDFGDYSVQIRIGNREPDSVTLHVRRLQPQA